MALGKCSNDGCGAPIEVPDVYKEVTVEKSPQFVALVYQCPECEDKNKFVASHEAWAKAQEKFAAARDIRKNDFRRHQIELDAIDTVEDLQALWSSLKNPPLREDSKGACTCPQCKEKWYGKGI
jgi:hypothetical protein